jgi:hypothetical protein
LKKPPIVSLRAPASLTLIGRDEAGWSIGSLSMKQR